MRRWYSAPFRQSFRTSDGPFVWQSPDDGTLESYPGFGVGESLGWGETRQTDFLEAPAPSGSSSGPYPEVNTLLPASGSGFYSYTNLERRYGRSQAIQAMQRIAAAWHQAYPQGPQIGYGDISFRGGGAMPPHKSHQLGLDVDIRPVRNDGKKGPTSYQDPTYSRQLTQELVDRIRANGVLRVQYIFFNDVPVRGVSQYQGHDNHLHVRFYPPTVSPGKPALQPAAAQGRIATPLTAAPQLGARPVTSGGGTVTVISVTPRASSPKSLENGVRTPTTARFVPAAGEPRDIVLAATGAAEGGYDTVNMYDRGILSWGIMQWTVHAGSLQRALAFIKRRLAEIGQAGLWQRLFPELDVRQIGGEFQLTYRGTPILGQPQLRQLFRGSPERGSFEPGTIRRWAQVFAIAGRDLLIQQLQREYARTEVDRVLSMNLGAHFGAKYARIYDYVGGNSRAITLFFGMWTNNPKYSYLHLKQAIDRLASAFQTYDTLRWPSGWRARLGTELERVLRASKFDWWGDDLARAAGRQSRTTKILNAFSQFGGR